MDKLEKAKEIIEKYYDDGNCGIYNSRNIVGDWMTNIYSYEGLTIDICYPYEYFEVFGLTDKEFSLLKEYYSELRKENLYK